MGRFYKTSSPQSLDFMYKLPQELLFKATQQASEDITQNQAGLLSLSDKLQASAIDQDMLRAKQIIAEKEAKIAELSKVLQDNPLEFRRKSGDIIGLGRNIQKEWTMGEMGAIQSRYSERAAWIKQQEDLLKAGRIKDARAVQLMLIENDRNTKPLNYNPATGSHTGWTGEQLTPEVDIEDRYMKFAKEMKTHITADNQSKSDGKYIVSWGNKTERLSKGEIDNMLWTKFKSDEDVQAYLKQRSRIGELSGYYDNSGNLINPIKITGYQTDPKTKEKQPVYGFNTDTKLGGMFSTISDVYDVNNVLDTHKDIKGDPYGVIDYSKAADAATTASQNAFNMPMTQRGTLPTIQDYTDVINAPQTTKTVSSGYILGGAQAGLAKSNKTSAEINAELAQLNVDIAQAQKEAEAGNTSKLEALYTQYAQNIPGLTRTDLIAGLGNIRNYPKQKVQAEIYVKQLASARSIAEQALVKKGNAHPTDAQIEVEVNDIITNPKYNQVNEQVYTTGGNDSDLWTDPKLRTWAIKNSAAIGKVLVDPNMWATQNPVSKEQSFIISVPDETSPGKMMYKEMTLADFRESPYANFGSNMKLVKPKRDMTGTDAPAATADEEDAAILMEESLKEAMDTGKISNKVGTAQIAPFTMSYDYQGLDGNIHNMKTKWAVRIPFTSSNKGQTGYILVDGGAVQNDTFANLKAVADQSSQDTDDILTARTAYGPVKNYAAANGIRLTPQDEWNLNLSSGKQYIGETREILTK